MATPGNNHDWFYFESNYNITLEDLEHFASGMMMYVYDESYDVFYQILTIGENPGGAGIQLGVSPDAFSTEDLIIKHAEVTTPGLQNAAMDVGTIGGYKDERDISYLDSAKGDKSPIIRKKFRL